MSAARRRRQAGKEERRARRRRRKVAAATSTVLLVAAAVAGEPIALTSGSIQAAAAAGGGLHGMTDPNSVGANGQPDEDDALGEEILAGAGDIDELLRLGNQGDLPNGPISGIPSTMMQAYQNAANRLAVEQPNCRLHWTLLAGIGKVESGHARGGQVDADGNTVPQILGPVLNGGGFAAIRDTDNGALDGDVRWDRAVGAMQFIPSTWQGYSSDGNNDGVSSPHNVFDSTLAAGNYLCSGGLDLSNPQDRATAVFRYNHSESYVATVLAWAEAYRSGVPILPNDPVEYSPGVQAMGPPPVVGPTPGGKNPTPQKPAPGTKPKPSPGGGGSSKPPISSSTSRTTITQTPTGGTTVTTSTTTITESPCSTTDEPSTTTETTTEVTTTEPDSTESTTTETTTSTTEPC